MTKPFAAVYSFIRCSVKSNNAQSLNHTKIWSCAQSYCDSSILVFSACILREACLIVRLGRSAEDKNLSYFSIRCIFHRMFLIVKPWRKADLHSYRQYLFTVQSSWKNLGLLVHNFAILTGHSPVWHALPSLPALAMWYPSWQTRLLMHNLSLLCFSLLIRLSSPIAVYTRPCIGVSFISRASETHDLPRHLWSQSSFGSWTASGETSWSWKLTPGAEARNVAGLYLLQ